MKQTKSELSKKKKSFYGHFKLKKKISAKEMLAGLRDENEVNETKMLELLEKGFRMGKLKFKSRAELHKQ